MSDRLEMKLGIVGHAQEKFTDETEAKARHAIWDAFAKHEPTHIVSGHSPMGGVDIFAEQEAAELGIPTIIYAPKVHIWDGPGGFKERNLEIAGASDLVLVIVVKNLPKDFEGMRFSGCYHCRDRNPRHVKSGACWTAWKAKAREWIII